MIARSVFAALLAGLLAGLFVAVVHEIRLSPLIAAAEVYENQTPAAEAGHSHAAGTPAEHEHDTDWKPADGLQRIAATSISWMLTGAGFGLLLAAVSLISATPITPRNAFIWGICGFLAVSIAPAAGIAPELPGMPAADLTARQIWWTATVLATGLAMLLVVKNRSWPTVVAALVLIAAPHVIGAPHPTTEESSVPATLAANFVGASLAVSALFWIVLGFALSKLLPNFNREPAT